MNYKFRAKVKGKNKYVEGFYIINYAPPVCFSSTKNEDEHCIMIKDPKYHPDWNMSYKYLQIPIEVETLSLSSGIVDLSGKEIFENDKIIPIYVSPSGSWRDNELDATYMGIVKFDHGNFKIFHEDGSFTNLNDYIEKERKHYIPNYGDLYVEKNNIALVKIVED